MTSQHVADLDLVWGLASYETLARNFLDIRDRQTQERLLELAFHDTALALPLVLTDGDFHDREDEVPGWVLARIASSEKLRELASEARWDPAAGRFNDGEDSLHGLAADMLDSLGRTKQLVESHAEVAQSLQLFLEELRNRT